MPAPSNGPPASSDSDTQPAWGEFVLRLFAAGTRRDMTAIALAEAERLFGCRDGLVAWSPAPAPGETPTWHAVPTPPNAADL